MAKSKLSMHGNSEREGAAWGRGEHSNMPKEVQMKSYPRASEAGPGDLDDTMTGIDRNMSMSSSKTRKNLSNQH